MMFQSQWRQFLTALQFLSRLPVKKDLNPTTEEFSGSAKFFPAVGALLGLILVFLEFLLRQTGISPELITIILIGFSFLITGGFHEDGFADTFDGIGGAFDKKKKLEIMKDSRIGTYGALGLIFLCLYRGQIWKAPTLEFAHLLPISWMWARFSSLILVRLMNHVSLDSKSKPLIDAISGSGLLFSSAFTLGLSYYFLSKTVFLAVFMSFFIVILISKWFFKKHLDGYTGDVLGAVNIITEFVVFTVGLRFWGL